jgi:hypothetical protein
MEEGPQFDSVIARALWKFIIVVDTQTGENFLVGPHHEKVPLPKYSTVIADAYKIVEHFQAQGYALKVRSSITSGKATYHAVFLRNDGQNYRFSEGSTLPMAICFAALSVCQGTNIAK